jgi:hypothetical protein
MRKPSHRFNQGTRSSVHHEAQSDLADESSAIFTLYQAIAESGDIG